MREWGARLAAVVLLGVWGVVKIPWEASMARDWEAVAHGALTAVDGKVRDQLGQGLALAALGGFRGLAANVLWMQAQAGWETQEWARVRTCVEMATTLQPRTAFFWDFGAWHLAWNASIAIEHHEREADPVRRRREALHWVEAGRQLLERGTATMPEKSVLWIRLAELYDQRLQDPLRAAEYYRIAATRPDAPSYPRRFVAYMLEKGGDLQGAYHHLKDLWSRAEQHPPHTPDNWPVVERRLRDLEKKLDIPAEMRIFKDGPITTK